MRRGRPSRGRRLTLRSIGLAGGVRCYPAALVAASQAAPRNFKLPADSARIPRNDGARPARRKTVTYADRTLTCVDCGAEFVHSAADQEYYQQKGFVSDPKRCASCRTARRSMRESGDSGGRSRGDGSPREFFAVVCSRCGNQAQVPFRPHMDRPVYCSDCFRAVHAE